MRYQGQDGQLELWEREDPISQGLESPSPGSPKQRPDSLFHPYDTQFTGALDTDFARKRPLNLLVADDNQINRKVICVILEKLGYRCSEAKNGAEALQLFKSKKFDYIFMDLDMPEVTGIEAAKSIRDFENKQSTKTAPQSEIIAVTANVSSETRIKCRRAGMNGYLEKPITAQTIKDQLLRSWPRIRSRRAHSASVD